MTLIYKILKVNTLLSDKEHISSFEERKGFTDVSNRMYALLDDPECNDYIRGKLKAAMKLCSVALDTMDKDKAVDARVGDSWIAAKGRRGSGDYDCVSNEVAVMKALVMDAFAASYYEFLNSRDMTKSLRTKMIAFYKEPVLPPDYGIKAKTSI